MTSLVRILVFTLLVLSPLITSAHGYWIELEGNHKAKQPVTVKLYFGEYHEGERTTGKYLDRMKDIKIYVQAPNEERLEVKMSQTNDFWVGSFTPSSSTTYEVVGINDTREVQDWTKHQLGIVRPIQYLKAYYTVGKKGDKAQSALTLDASVTRLSKGKYEITITKEGQPINEQNVSISGFGEESQELFTNKDGKTTVTLEKKGLHIISVDWIDKTPGTFKGKEYKTVRHRLDYSLYY